MLKNLISFNIEPFSTKELREISKKLLFLTNFDKSWEGEELDTSPFIIFFKKEY